MKRRLVFAPLLLVGRATTLDATFAPLTFVDPPRHASGFSSFCLFGTLTNRSCFCPEIAPFVETGEWRLALAA